MLSAVFTLDILDIIGVYISAEEHHLLIYPQNSAVLSQRKRRFTARDWRNFHYHMLQFSPRGPDSFPYHYEINDLFASAVNCGSIDRLNNLKRFSKDLQLAGVKPCTSPEVLTWLCENKTYVTIRDQETLVHYVTYSCNARILNKIEGLFTQRINIKVLESVFNAEILRWFFARPHLLDTSKARIDLDVFLARRELIELWINEAPVSFSSFTYEFLIDFATSRKELDLYFNTFLNFYYSSFAIYIAVQDDNYEVLQWWEDRYNEGSVKFKLPDVILITKSLSKEVLNWTNKYHVALT